MYFYNYNLLNVGNISRFIICKILKLKFEFSREDMKRSLIDDEDDS